VAKERLSKLQKWILNHCLENKETGITRDEIREFWNKKLPPKSNFLTEALKEANFGIKGEKFIWDGRYFSVRKELISTRSIEASISRSFNNLIKRGFVIGNSPWRKHYLTEMGFLKVNKKENSKSVNTYENYIDAINKANEEMEKHYKKLLGDLKKINMKGL